MYIVLELMILIALTFSHYHSLYFGTLLVSSLVLIPYSLGFFFKLLDILPGNARWASLILITIGWYAMITGQHLVLWSRLHLIVGGDNQRKILAYTKWMIVIGAITLHIPTTVVTFGSNGSTNATGFLRIYNVWEKVQMSGFL